MANLIADHFAKLLYDGEMHCPDQFEMDLRAAMQDNDYERADFLYDMRTGITELLNEYEQDISSNDAERDLQISYVFKKIGICHDLALRDEVILATLSNIVRANSEIRAEIKNNPEVTIKRLTMNTGRLSVKNFTKVGMDTMNLALINTFPLETIKKAELPEKYLKLLLKLTGRQEYISIMDNSAKRNVLNDGLGM